MGHFRPFLFFIPKQTRGDLLKGHYKRSGERPHKRNWYIYKCDHPVYNSCTLFSDGEYGLAVIQQRFNDTEKLSWWGPIDPWIADDIQLSDKFLIGFSAMAGPPTNGIFPTIEVRKLMYALGMKPLKKKIWETSFRSLS